MSVFAASSYGGPKIPRHIKRDSPAGKYLRPEFQKLSSAPLNKEAGTGLYHASDATFATILPWYEISGLLLGLFWQIGIVIRWAKLTLNG